MRNIFNKLKMMGAATILFSLPFCSFALNSQTLNQEQTQVNGVGGGITTGTNNAMTYLKYTVWAAAVMGILAVAFMLFNNVQETILKTVIRVVVVICVVALAFVVPGWFNLPIVAAYLS